MTSLSIVLDKTNEATLTAKGITPSEMAKAVNEAVWIAFGADPDVRIDQEIAQKFRTDRIGVTGEDGIAWLRSLDGDQPLAVPKSNWVN